MHRVHNHSLDYWRFESFPDDGVQQHGVLTRSGGVSVGPFASLNLSTAVPDARPAVEENRRRAYGVFGRTVTTLVHAHLVHGDRVTRVGRADQGRVAAQSDGLITDEPGCGLTMNFADCAPIFLYDPQRRAIGLGHAGWKGALGDLPGALVRAMQAAFGSDPAALLAAVGPCIGVGRYEVDEPVISQVRAAFPAAADDLLVYPNGRDRRPHFDLVHANRLNLARAGVRHIEDAGVCTAERTDLFFSHRAENGRTGRFGTVFLLT